MSEFQAAERERTGKGTTFELAGRTWSVRRRLPFGLIGQLANSMQEGEGMEVFNAFVRLLVASVVKDERADFHAALLAVPEDEDDDETTVTFADVQRVATVVIEQATGTPFGAASDSQPLPLRAGAMSRVPVSEGDSTSVPHRRVKLS